MTIEGAIMKCKNILLGIAMLLLLMIPLKICSQSGNAKSLEIGNKWVYENWFGPFGGPYEYSYSIERVVGDTVINNRLYAAVLQGNYTYFERADSMNVYLYNTYADSEYIQIGFNQVDSTWLSNGTFIKVDTINYWGRDRVKITEYSSSPGMGDGEISYIEGIGEEMKTNGRANYYSGQLLVAAYLNGVKYGDTTLVSVKRKEQIPKNFELLQNYPNPFNPTTSIEYSVPSTEMVTLDIYDILGKKVATLVKAIQNAGSYSVQLSTNRYQLTSSIYFYRLTAGNYSATRKMILMK